MRRVGTLPRRKDKIERLKKEVKTKEYWEHATEGLANLLVDAIYNDKEEQILAKPPEGTEWRLKKKKQGTRWSDE